MEKLNYDKAYTEVIEVLNNVPIEDYNKIPKKFITYMEENCDQNQSFTYNIALPFEKQEISEEAKNILAMIYRLFWTTGEGKEELNKEDTIIIKQKELEKREKYNPDNIFKNNSKYKNDVSENSVDTKKIKIEENKSLVQIEKQKWYLKIFEKIKGIFKRK